jgi:hypothetical protein
VLSIACAEPRHAWTANGRVSAAAAIEGRSRACPTPKRAVPVPSIVCAERRRVSRANGRVSVTAGIPGRWSNERNDGHRGALRPCTSVPAPRWPIPRADLADRELAFRRASRPISSDGSICHVVAWYEARGNCHDLAWIASCLPAARLMVRGCGSSTAVARRSGVRSAASWRTLVGVGTNMTDASPARSKP